MRFKWKIAVFAGLMLCTPPVSAQTAFDHFHWRPAASDGTARPWAILLPGVSGLSIFEDDQHYFNFAKWLNARGIDALIIDYRLATKLLPDTQKGKPGPRIARIVSHALTDARAKGRMVARCPGVVFGWSLGGEGMWQLAGEGGDGLRAAVGYYPSVRGQSVGFTSKIPVLVLQGEADRITKSSALTKFIGQMGPSSVAVTQWQWGGAMHGFDVASLGANRRDLQSDAAASRGALDAIATFIDPVVSKGCEKE